MKKHTQTTSITRPPIVAVLGHVDHGKTTLLDTIRRSHVTQTEVGGITQHIGAYQVEIKNHPPAGGSKVKSLEGKITFIDTPGHEAFAKMRSRGAQVADMAILVVAASDGVMPQTEESVRYVKAANIPLVVAINKIDLPEADIERTKQQLGKIGVLVEGYGGDVVVVPVSAKTGKNISQLLEVILLLSEMKGLPVDTTAPVSAVVIEAKLDKHRGVIATLIVKNGTLSVGQTIYAETVKAKVKAMTNDRGERINLATPGMPVEVMGWEKIPLVGSLVGLTQTPTSAAISTEKKYTFELPPLTTETKLKLILKADVAGSLEVITENLGKLVKIVASGTGEIGEADVMLAKSADAAIIGFNVKTAPAAQKLASVEKVRIRTYSIIYQLFDEIAEVVQLLNQPHLQEQILGEAKIIAEFVFSQQRVAGCKVNSGRMSRGDTIKILREEVEVGRGRVKSLRHGKEDIPKAEINSECGMMFDRKLDFKLGDLIIAYKIHELLA